MKAKHYFLTTFFFFCLVQLFGQSLSTTLKLYSGFTIFQSSYNPELLDYELHTINYLGISPAISIKKEEKALSHELEPKLRWRKWETQTAAINDLELGLRYEALWYLPTNIKEKMFFRLGGSFRLYYYRGEQEPFDESGIPRIDKNQGMELAGAAHIEYWLTKRLVLDLNLIMLNINSAVETTLLDHPLLTERQRESQLFSIDVGNQRILRIGLGYKL